LGGATLAWHAHPGKPFDYAGRVIMRYHHPRTGAYTSVAAPPMVDVLTINGFADWLTTGSALIGGGYKPPLIIVEATATRAQARPICEYLNARGYRAAWHVVRAYDVGAPHVRYRAYVIAARNDCDVPAVNAAYLDADRRTGALWPTPEVDDTRLVETAYQWALDDLAGHPDKGRTLALEHWAKVTGEPYPYPIYTTPTHDTQGSATLAFIEWMMGLPVGYVSTPSLPLIRAERLRLLQTGTVPLQAAHAVAVGLTQMGEQ
jgi:C-5 cytosine-specific DNA methylase